MLKPEINLYLDKSKNPDKEGKFQIFLLVTKYGDSRAKLSSGVKSLPECWNGESVTGDRPANKLLSDRIQIVERICSNADLNNEVLTKEALKEEYDRLTKGETARRKAEKKSQKTFWEFYDEWEEESKGRISKQTGRTLSTRTLTAYNTTQEVLQAFEIKSGYRLKPETITDSFYNKFSNYIINELEQEPSNFGFHVKNFKVFLKWLKKRTENLKADYEDFEVPRSQPNPKPLKPVELLRFWDAKMPSKHLEKNLDIFLALCSSALRISDYNKIDEVEEIDTIEGRILIGRSKKTNQEFIIPMFNTQYFRFREIYEKYDGKLPKISGQKLNESLAIIQRLIGFKRIPVTSKTARRTFATIGYFTLGISKSTMKRFTGHSSDQSFDTYVGIDDMEIIKEFREKTSANNLRITG